MPDSMSNFKLGIGWDSRCNVEGNIVILDHDGEELECPDFKNHKLRWGTVLSVDFRVLPPNAESIWSIIKIHNVDNILNDITPPYCRIYD